MKIYLESRSISRASYEYDKNKPKEVAFYRKTSCYQEDLTNPFGPAMFVFLRQHWPIEAGNYELHYFRSGKRHRTDGPAIINSYNNGKEVNVKWFKNNYRKTNKETFFQRSSTRDKFRLLCSEHFLSW